ncbi:hypothetical protein T11_4813, partial [Trichinella zimbabwensis]
MAIAEVHSKYSDKKGLPPAIGYAIVHVNKTRVVNVKQAIRDDEDIAPSLWNRWHLLCRHKRIRRYADLLSFELNRSEYTFKGKQLHWLPVSNPWYQQTVENSLVSKKKSKSKQAASGVLKKIEM